MYILTLQVPASALFLVAYEGIKRLLITLEVTQRAAQLVNIKAAQEARELARKTRKAAKLKKREEEEQRRQRRGMQETNGLLPDNEFEDLSSPRAMSEAVLASIVLSGPAMRRLRNTLQIRKMLAERKNKKK